MIVSRRYFAGTLSALLLSSASMKRALASSSSPVIGLNTWSLRYLNHDEAIPVILQLMQETRLTECQLLFSHVEPTEFDPQFGSQSRPSPEQQKQKDDARTAWRLSVPMSYFEAVRSQFTKHGLRIRIYSAPLNGTTQEVDRVLQMAKTLGAEQVNTRVAESQTDLVAAAAERHGIFVGLQVVDPAVVAQQMRASSRFRSDPDIGDLTKAGIPAFEYVQSNLNRIASIDLKDALSHGPSVPFGTGESHMQQVLELLRRTHSPCIGYIDCDFPGTGRSRDEVKRSLSYVRGVVGA